MATGAPASGSGTGAPAGTGASPAAPSPAASPSGAPSIDSSKAPSGPTRGPIRPIQDQTDNDSMSAVERRKIRAKEAAKPQAQRDQEAAAEAKKKSETGAQQSGQGQVRDESGRFVAVSGAEELRGDKSALEARKEQQAQAKNPPKAAAAAPAPDPKAQPQPRSQPATTDISLPDGPTADGKFALGGKIYADHAAAGQAHRSLQGIHKSLETTTAKAAELSRGWETAYTRDVGRLRAEIQRLSGGGSPQPGQSPTPTTPQAAAAGQTQAGASATPAAPEPFSKSMDWKAFHQLYNSPEFGPVGAQIHLSQQLDAYLTKALGFLKTELADTFKKDLDPLRATSDLVQRRIQSQQALEGARVLWSQVAEAKNPETGQPYYPELAENPKLIEEVLPIWLSLGPQQGMTDQGIFTAYLMWKHHRGESQSRQSDAGETAASIIASAQQAGNSAAARSVVSGAGSPPIPTTSPTADQTRSARAAAVVDGIKRAQGTFVSSTGLKLGRMNR